MDNIKIIGEVLHLSEKLHEPVKRLLRGIVYMYGHQNIWVTGHSLGAALALIATRSLALDHHIVINPYLFNLPYATGGRLASKVMTGFFNGVGDLGNKVFHASGMKNSWNIRACTDKVCNVCKKQVGNLLWWVRGIANSSYAENMEEESKKLLQIGYCPHLFVNPKDPICNEYNQHFQRYHHVNTSFFSEVMQWAVSAKSVHMIPSADLYINNWGEGPLEAHKINQWFRYPPVDLTVERQGRTADQISPAPQHCPQWLAQYQRPQSFAASTVPTMASSTSMFATMAGSGSMFATMAGSGSMFATMAGSGPMFATMAGSGPMFATIAGSRSMFATMAGSRSMFATMAGSGSMFATMAGSGPTFATMAGSGPTLFTMAGPGPVFAAPTFGMPTSNVHIRINI
jgi:hypothetical protein